MSDTTNFVGEDVSLEGCSREEGTSPQDNTTVNITNKPNHYLQHRSRVQGRVVASPDAMLHYEVLEALLFTAIPRKDVKGVSKILLDRFQTVNGVLHASCDELMTVSGVGKATALTIKTYDCVLRFALKERLTNSTVVIDSDSALLQFCKKYLALDATERCYLFLLNAKNRLIEHSLHTSGDKHSSMVYVSEILKKAVLASASGVIIVHNHPSGDPTPSIDDKKITFRIRESLKLVDIDLLDHVIIGRARAYSLLNSIYMEFSL